MTLSLELSGEQLVGLVAFFVVASIVIGLMVRYGRVTSTDLKSGAEGNLFDHHITEE